MKRGSGPARFSRRSAPLSAGVTRHMAARAIDTLFIGSSFWFVFSMSRYAHVIEHASRQSLSLILRRQSAFARSITGKTHKSSSGRHPAWTGTRRSTCRASASLLHAWWDSRLTMDQATHNPYHVAVIPQVRPRNCSSAGDQRPWLLAFTISGGVVVAGYDGCALSKNAKEP